jgi:glucosylceramidase
MILVLLALAFLDGCGGSSSVVPPPPPPPPPAAATPSFWPPAGTYSPIEITLADATSNSTIYYTTDGSAPTTSASKYTAPLPISAATTVKAIATASGYSSSAIATATYSVPAQNGTGPAISTVLSTDDQSLKMQPQSATNFTTATASGNVIYVDESQTYQPIEGFGAAFTDSAAYLLNEVAQKSALSSTMKDLFTRAGNGIGLSFMRTPMAASDIARTQYSYDDNGGQPDPTLANFSVAHDQADVVPIVLQAQQLNPQMKLMANPWSPPSWMKTSGSMVGGGLQSSMYSSWAQYFVKYLQAYSAAGVHVDYISVQNEPSILTSDYPGMCFPASPGFAVCNQPWAADETTGIRDYILPALTSAGLSTKVLVQDDNWCSSNYALSILSDPSLASSPQIAGIGWHGYCPSSGVMTVFNNAFPAFGNYETEHSGGTWLADQEKSDFEEITQVMRNWGRAYVKWSLALDQNLGPHTGGCGTCTPIVTVNSSTGAVTYTVEYFTMGHFSKFVLPGAVRIYSSNAQGTVTAAFLNSDGSKVLVAYNDSGAPQSFSVQWGNQSFAYTLPSLAGATFIWSGSQTGNYVVPATSQIQVSSFNRTAGTNNPADPTTYGFETETTSDANGGYDVGYATAGDYAVFKSVDFGAGINGVAARLACNGNCGGSLEFHLDSPSGTLIGSVVIPGTGGWQNWITVNTSAGGAVGVHDLYVVITAAPSGMTNLGNVNWFQFN